MERVIQHLESDSTQTSRFNLLRDVALYVLRLGTTGFGGPLAVVAQLERDVVDRWITRAEFSQAFAAIKTLPGPFAFQMVVFVAFQHGKKAKVSLAAATLAAIAFILPSLLLMTALALTRQTWGDWAWTRSFLVGLQAAALGLIVASLIPLARSLKVTSQSQKIAKWMFALFGFTITLLRPSLEPFAILVCGFLSLAPVRNRFFTAVVVGTPVALIGVSAYQIHETLFLTTLKAGSLVFGSGLAILPILGGEFVDRLQWLNHGEFLEALMFGQISPGPILITATYIGARVAGVTGALVATLGVFIVPFAHMTTWFPRLWHRVASSHQWTRFSFGAIAAVIGSVLAGIVKLFEPVVLSAFEIETFGLNRTVLTFLLWLLIPPVAFYVTFIKKQPAWAVVLAGGIIALVALAV